MSSKRKHDQIDCDDAESDNENQLKPDSGLGDEDFHSDDSQANDQLNKVEVTEEVKGLIPNQFLDINKLKSMSRNWTIKGRIFRKTKIVPFKNNSRRKFFYFDIRDNSGEIRVVAFDGLCDRFHRLVSKGQIFVLKNGTVKRAERLYNTCPSNQLEIVLNSDSVIEPSITEPAESIPTLPEFDFKPLSKLYDESLDSKDKIDVIGVITSDCDVGEYSNEHHRNCHNLRTIELVDQSGAQVPINIWNHRAVDFAAQKGDILAIKSANISSPGKSRYLNVFHGFFLEPEINELDATVELRKWLKMQNEFSFK